MWRMAIALLALAVSASCQTPAKPITVRPQPTESKLPADTGPDPELPPAKILPDTHVAAGRLHESQGQLARAAEQYRMAVGVKPDHIEANSRLGVVLDKLGKFEEADKYLSRAIQLAPRQAHLHNNLAFSYIMQGRWTEAEAALRKALVLQPSFPRAQVNLGTVLAQQNRFEESFECFGQVLRPEDAYYNIGLMYQSKKLPVEAARAFKQALAANPRMAAATKRLGLLPPEAVSEADRLGELFPAKTPPNAQAALATRPATQPEDTTTQVDANASDEADDVPSWLMSPPFADAWGDLNPAEPLAVLPLK